MVVNIILLLSRTTTIDSTIDVSTITSHVSHSFREEGNCMWNKEVVCRQCGRWTRRKEVFKLRPCQSTVPCFRDEVICPTIIIAESVAWLILYKLVALTIAWRVHETPLLDEVYINPPSPIRMKFTPSRLLTSLNMKQALSLQTLSWAVGREGELSVNVASVAAVAAFEMYKATMLCLLSPKYTPATTAAPFVPTAIPLSAYAFAVYLKFPRFLILSQQSAVNAGLTTLIGVWIPSQFASFASVIRNIVPVTVVTKKIVWHLLWLSGPS